MESLGGWSIDEDIIDVLLEQKVKTLVELGSGYASYRMASEFGITVYSVEDKKEYVNKYAHPFLTYLFAPLRVDKGHKDFEEFKEWYDPNCIVPGTPDEYDAILVDGPSGSSNRAGFYKHRALFDTSKLMIFDDVHRITEYRTALLTARSVGRDLVIKGMMNRKQFGVIYAAPPNSLPSVL